MKRPRSVLVLSALLAGTLPPHFGCATVFSGSRQEISVASRPEGAEIWLNGDFVGRTPLAVEFDRNQPPLLVLKKDGFADTRVRIRRSTNGWLALNIPIIPLLGAGLIGLGLDSRAGTAASYTEPEIVVPLLAPGAAPRSLYGGNVSLTDVSPAEPEEKTEDENGGEDESEK